MLHRIQTLLRYHNFPIVIFLFSVRWLEWMNLDWMGEAGGFGQKISAYSSGFVNRDFLGKTLFFISKLYHK